VNEKSVYIIDIFTIPESRKKGEAAQLADLIAAEAKERGCTEMLGSVVPSTKGSTASLKVLLAYGMTLKEAGQDFIIFRKDI
jgi:GNAT superfamily N-acetyltransferase